MMGFGFGGFGILFMLVFWVGIIALGVWLLSSLFPRAAGPAPSQNTWQREAAPESALEILQRRYARGEISRGEYEQMRQELLG